MAQSNPSGKPRISAVIAEGAHFTVLTCDANQSEPAPFRPILSVAYLPTLGQALNMADAIERPDLK